MSNTHPKFELIVPSASTFDPINLESEILQLCLQFPNGVSNKILENSFPNITLEQRVNAINRLLALHKIDLLTSSTEPGTYIYRIRDQINKSNSSISIGNEITDPMERTVYQIVEESGNLGIWMRDIRFKVKLSPTILNKILKSLESKKLIKAVKSVHANKKKVYMLYELTPDPSITGGTWYSDQEFEAEFVRILNEQCARLLDERREESIEKFPNDPFLQRTSSFMSSSELVSVINQMGISTVTLTVQDIESILYTLICDGKIEKMIVASTTMNANGTKQNLYKSIKSMIDSAPIQNISIVKSNDYHKQQACRLINNQFTKRDHLKSKMEVIIERPPELIHDGKTVTFRKEDHHIIIANFPYHRRSKSESDKNKINRFYLIINSKIDSFSLNLRQQIPIVQQLIK
ncbi:unnamed protein product [Rotaria sordida]|uniref:RNA polymerase III subunit C6 n=1 Tax=Rotaria sordida TaxID=392033 RepID=A0A815ESC2_9BILA|nr:unnamed protein product [Rotaria sordida]CAF1316096.1 unnamed protein product [Rotaria sordida]